MIKITTLNSQPNAGIILAQYVGSDCSGADKTKNRTLTVPNGTQLIFVERNLLIPTTDFTISGTTVTFLIAVDNRQRILVAQ